MRHSSKLYKFITRRPPVAIHHPLVSYYNAMPRTITIAPMNIRPLTTSSPRTASSSSSSSSPPSSAPFAKDIEQFGQTYRPRRALLYMPGSSPKMLLKATTLTQVDVVCMDLEDSVAEHQKVEARKNIVEALNKWKVEPYVKGQHRTERLVRINPIGSGFEEQDLETILRGSTYLDGIVIPKVECASHIEYVDSAMVRLLGAEKAKNLIIIALIESTEGMLNIREIARSSKRLRGFIFGADDYRASVGAIKTSSNHEVSFARNLVLLHAKAAGLDAIDLVQTDFKDLPLIQAESRQGYEMGYTGKQIIHPNQIEVVQKAYAPDAESIAWARKVLEEFRKKEADGVGAFVVDGLMVDMPLIKKAAQIVLKAQACGIISNGSGEGL